MPRASEVAAFLVSVTLFGGLFFAGQHQVVAWGVPLTLITILGYANWQMLRTSAAAVWTPLFALRLSALVYFGIGSLVPLVFGEETEEAARDMYAYTDAEQSKALMLWLVTMAVVITAAWLTSLLLENQVIDKSINWNKESRPHDLFIGLLFFIPGFLEVSLYELPNTLGWVKITIPGSLVLLLQAMEGTGLFLVAIWSMRKGGLAHLCYIIPVIALFFLSVITMNKSITLTAVLFLVLAILYRGVTATALAVSVAILAGAFAVLQPLIAQSRFIHEQVYGEDPGGTIGERLGYASDYLRGVRYNDPGSVSPLLRLTYTLPATFVMARYDVGYPSAEIEGAGFALIPRAIWPAKPNVTGMGNQLHDMITGQDTSALGMTVPADLYWNFGWVGPLVVAALWGGILPLASRATHDIVLRRDWLLMPFVLLCFQIGVSVDSEFVSGILVPTVTAALALPLLRLAKQLLPWGKEAADGAQIEAPSPVTSRADR